MIVVTSGEVLIGDGDHSFDTWVDVWLYFRKMATPWRLLRNEVSNQAYP